MSDRHMLLFTDTRTRSNVNRTWNIERCWLKSITSGCCAFKPTCCRYCSSVRFNQNPQTSDFYRHSAQELFGLELVFFCLFFFRDLSWIAGHQSLLNFIFSVHQRHLYSTFTLPPPLVYTSACSLHMLHTEMVVPLCSVLNCFELLNAI